MLCRDRDHIPDERWASSDLAMFMIYDEDVDSFQSKTLFTQPLKLMLISKRIVNEG
jgi:hypothetical protein